MEFLHDPQVMIFGKFVIAMVLGAVIGLEREVSAKPAGLRTHMIVVGVACLVMSLNQVMKAAAGEASGTVLQRSDPLRLVQGLIMGISFIGAGTIIRRAASDKVEGLTTAASILLSTVIGVYVALSQYFVAIAVTVLAVVVLHQLPAITDRFKPKSGD